MGKSLFLTAFVLFSIASSRVWADSDCYVTFQTTTQVLDLSAWGMPVFTESRTSDFATKPGVWSAPTDAKVKAGDNFGIRYGIVSYVMIIVPDTCGSEFVVDRVEGKFIGSYTDSGRNQIKIYAAVGASGVWNTPIALSSRGIVFLRQSRSTPPSVVPEKTRTYRVFYDSSISTCYSDIKYLVGPSGRLTDVRVEGAGSAEGVADFDAVDSIAKEVNLLSCVDHVVDKFSNRPIKKR